MQVLSGCYPKKVKKGDNTLMARNQDLMKAPCPRVFLEDNTLDNTLITPWGPPRGKFPG
jgi:hypothetical protein